MVTLPAALRPVGFHERCRTVKVQRREAWGRAPDGQELSEGLPVPREPAYDDERSQDGEAMAASE
ncbi:MAG: hypothetical protein ACR2IT_10130 [Pirellulales bacterium]